MPIDFDNLRAGDIINATPDEYVKVAEFIFGQSDFNYYFYANAIKEAKANTPENNLKIIKNLEKKIQPVLRQGSDGVMRRYTKYLSENPLPIVFDRIFQQNLDRKGFEALFNIQKEHASDIQGGWDPSFLFSPLTTPADVDEYLKEGEYAKIGHSDSPEVKLMRADSNLPGASQILPRHYDYIIKNSVHPSAVVHASERKDSFTDEEIEHVLESYSSHLFDGHLDNFLEKLTPEKRKEIIDNKLGITGGEIHDLDAEHYNNWIAGPEYNRRLATKLANSQYLDPAQMDHIVRHGSDDAKRNLFLHNENLPRETAARMHEKFLNNHYHHGYDLDRLRSDLKENYDFDRWYSRNIETYRDEAEQDYPLREHLDEYSDEDLLGSRSAWIENYLNNNFEWDEDQNMDEHPDYDERYEQAMEAHSEEADAIRANYDPEVHGWRPQNSYDDAIAARIHEKALDAYDRLAEEAEKHQDFYPEHLKHLVEAQEQKPKNAISSKNQRAWDKAKEDIDGSRPFLDRMMPKGFFTSHAYGSGLTHLELAKKFADANGGVIDFGTLAKKIPNPNALKQWKAILPKGGKITSEQLQQKIDALPKKNYNISYVPWTAQRSQNLNQEDQVVVRLDHSPETLQELAKDPEAFEIFNKVNQVAQQSGHPSNYNTVGWARVDMNDPEHWIIDEVQRDHDKAARDFLNKNGQGSKAEALDRIMETHKDWRHQLFNAVQKLAEMNGVKRISTHSPESKAAHTGAEKIHSVYKDSYQGVPREVGFKPDLALNLPLTEQGMKAFGRQSPDQKLIGQYEEAMEQHAHVARAHDNLRWDLMEKMKSMDDAKIVAHNDAIKYHHLDKMKAFGEKIKQMDPERPVLIYANLNSPVSVIENLTGEPAGLMASPESRLGAQEDLDAYMKNPEAGYAHLPLVSLLNKDFGHLLEKPVPPPQPLHSAHTLDLTPEAFKKNILEELTLIKMEGFEDNNVKIIQAFQFIEENKDILEELKQAKPDVYQAIQEAIASLLDLFKQSRGKSIKALAQQMEMQSELDSQMSQDPTDESPEGKIHYAPGARTDEEPHNHQLVYPIGAERDHADNQRREKQPDGSWKNITTGIQNPQDGQ